MAQFEVGWSVRYFAKVEANSFKEAFGKICNDRNSLTHVEEEKPFDLSVREVGGLRRLWEQKEIGANIRESHRPRGKTR